MIGVDWSRVNERFPLIRSTTVCTTHDIRHLHVLLIFFISSNKQTMLITCVKVLTETKKIADEEA